eukprot:TRINITY_DN1144_c0_g2_i2.p3 TRINITY_DN1144_c0_g2~~TRINITY_DN1144_c0_g2_i2.p3  ORF type:complete len:167 (-),score=30.21 TRINITY_DN1144_c0_g2_i2:575-1075(-)
MFQAPGTLIFETRFDKENTITPTSRQKVHDSIKPSNRVALGDLSNASVKRTPLSAKPIQKAPVKQVKKVVKAAERIEPEYTHISKCPDPLPKISYLEDIDFNRLKNPITPFPPALGLGSKKGASSSSLDFDEEAFLESIATKDCSIFDDHDLDFALDLAVQLPELE